MPDAAPAGVRRPGWVGRWWRAGGTVAAVGMSVAAAVILVTRPAAEPVADTPPATVTEGAVGGPADKALCAAVAPLAKEASAVDTALANTGAYGTPASDAAIPAFKAGVQDWLNRIEPVLAAHPDASGYLLRNLHRYVDDRRIYAAMLDPGKEQPEYIASWHDELVALGAPYEVCPPLGAWWR